MPTKPLPLFNIETSSAGTEPPSQFKNRDLIKQEPVGSPAAPPNSPGRKAGTFSFSMQHDDFAMFMGCLERIKTVIPFGIKKGQFVTAIANYLQSLNDEEFNSFMRTVFFPK